MNLEAILDKIQTDESMAAATTSSGNAFGMDSFPETKKRKRKVFCELYTQKCYFSFKKKEH